MCGIAGIIHSDSHQIVNEAKLIAMRDSMAHRGPDGAGHFIECNIGLAHRRLSIIDLSNEASQPFVSNSGRFIIVFNGEIFNYQELKDELISKEYSFRTKSDTEVLLGLYEVYGSGMLEKLNGMFAFAIFDKLLKTIFIARDRIGIKPLYYSFYNNSFYFASEPKALLAAGIPSEINGNGLNELLLFRFVAGENTIFKYIRKLLPGYSLLLNQNSKPVFTRWWNLSEKIIENRDKPPKNPFEWFEETFYSSVSYRTISDVPVGIMLSGGLDSGSVAAALSHNGQQDMAAFTVAFEDNNYNEGPLARKVALKFGLQYHEITVTGKDLLNALNQAAWYHDEPLVHQNDAQMLALANYAKEFVTVLLSGEGGDEFMGGYVRYKPLNYYKGLQLAGGISGLLKHFNFGGIVNRFDKLERYAENSTLRDLVLLNSSNIYPADLKKLGIKIDMDSFEYRNQVYREAQQVYPTEPARQAMYLDLFTHMASVLDRNDRMTMGAGIECRVPFMDYRLMEMIPALPSDFLLKGKKGKYLLYNSVAQNLPREVLGFKKLGFSVPWEKYFKTDPVFKNFVQELNSSKSVELFQKISPSKLKEGFTAGDEVSNSIIRQLYMIQLWMDAYKLS